MRFRQGSSSGLESAELLHSMNFWSTLGKRKGALIRRFLIVLVVFHNPQIVIAGQMIGITKTSPFFSLLQSDWNSWTFSNTCSGRIGKTMNIDQHLSIF